jgi:hypothetical protein
MELQVLYQWTEKIATHIPSLNSWQVNNVALFSQGVAEAESCQQDAIARKVIGEEDVTSAARRLRRFLNNQSLDPVQFMKDWTEWVVNSYQGDQLNLLVDETKLNGTLGIMVVGLAWESRCIPLAWRCYKVDEYPQEGQVELIKQLLEPIHAAISDDWRVYLMADRGIGTSPDLCDVVDNLDWFYLFRVTCQTKLVTDAAEYTIYQQVNEGERWQGSGRVFKQRGKIPAHARAIWSEGYDEPWALVTNDPSLTGDEYAKRNWQEQSFRDLKSGGWYWGESQARLPDHMDRLLILLVVAYGWMLALGSHAVQHGRTHHLISDESGELRRHYSLFKEGLHFFVEYVVRRAKCPGLLFAPDVRLS